MTLLDRPAMSPPVPSTDITSAATANDVPRGGGWPIWHPMTPMNGFDADGFEIVEARGARVTDRSGRTYLDCISGLWNVCLGYSHPGLVAAVQAQLEELPFFPLFGGRAHAPALRLAQVLLEVAPMDAGRVFYATSGSSAVDSALKLALRAQRLNGHPGRRHVIALTGSYHGTCFGSMAVTGEDIEQREYGVDVSWAHHVPHDEPEALVALLAELEDQVAAVVVEPVLGTGAHVLGPQMVAALNTARRDGLFLVVDEVTTGIGRTGSLFAVEQLGLEPDMMVLSKGLTGGYLPMAAVLVGQSICSLFDTAQVTFSHGETQAGNPLACSAALAVLDVVARPATLSHIRALSEHLSGALDRLSAEDPVVAGHRGLGLMRAVQVRQLNGAPLAPHRVAELVAAARACGVLVYASPGGIGLLPAFIMTTADIDELVERVSDALAAMAW